MLWRFQVGKRHFVHAYWIVHQVELEQDLNKRGRDGPRDMVQRGSHAGRIASVSLADRLELTYEAQPADRGDGKADLLRC